MGKKLVAVRQILVTLDHDYYVEELKDLVGALRQIKGVKSASPVVSYQDLSAEPAQAESERVAQDTAGRSFKS